MGKLQAAGVNLPRDLVGMEESEVASLVEQVGHKAFLRRAVRAAEAAEKARQSSEVPAGQQPVTSQQSQTAQAPSPEAINAQKIAEALGGSPPATMGGPRSRTSTSYWMQQVARAFAGA